MEVSPVVDLGRLAAKATVGEPLPVRASVFREGHDQLSAEVTAAFMCVGVPHRVQHAGSLFSVFLGLEDPVRDYAEAQQQDTGAFAAFFHSMLDAGVALPPSAYEAWFVSAAHSDGAIARIVEALPAAATAAARVLAR